MFLCCSKSVVSKRHHDRLLARRFAPHRESLHCRMRVFCERNCHASVVRLPLVRRSKVRSPQTRAVSKFWHADDAFARAWRSFDPVRAGELIGTRTSGETVSAPHDGWIVFPYAAAPARQEWFYLARASARFA